MSDILYLPYLALGIVLLLVQIHKSCNIQLANLLTI